MFFIKIVGPLIFVCITESVRLVCQFYLYVPFFSDYFMTNNNVIFLTNYIMCPKNGTEGVLNFLGQFYFLQ